MNEIVNMKYEKSLQAGHRRTPRDQKKRKQTHSGVNYSVFFYFRYSWDSGPPDLPLPGPGCVCGVLGVPDLLAKTRQASAPPARGGHLCLSDR